MGQFLLIITIEITGLFLVSRKLINSLYAVFLLLFRNRPSAVSFTTLILFPGTVIHELSHLFTAEILGVKTGKLTLAPESIEQEDINVGTVEFRKTDPFRRTAIGLAPFFVGLVALFSLSSILPNLWNNAVIAYNQGSLLSSPSSYLLPLTSYLLFCISNTMFSSKEDMKGVIPLLVVLGILGAAGYMLGIRIGITGVLEKKAIAVLSAVSKSLSIVLALNLTLYLLTSAPLWLIKRLKGKI